MTPDRPTPPPSRPGRTDSWRIERMVQRVPAHLGETTHEPVSPWVVIAGVLLLMLVSCGVLLVLLDVPSRLAGLGIQGQPTATRTPRVVTPAVTILPVTLPPPTATVGPTVATRKHKVVAGDTLSSISVKYKVSIEAIKAANGLRDDTVRIGEELIIPLPTATPAGGAQLPQAPSSAGAPQLSLSTPTTIALQSLPPSAVPATAPGTVRHTVAKGDTLISIAAVYGSTVDSIRLANQLIGDMLSVGQVLQVPVGAWTPTTVPVAALPPTATPTSQFAYSAPNLTWPLPSENIRGKEGAPTLGWTAPATLKTGEFYVVHLDYAVNGVKQSIVRQAGQATSLALSAKDYPGPNASGTEFKWYVVVVGSPATQARASVSNPEMFAQSPPSETRTFLWY